MSTETNYYCFAERGVKSGFVKEKPANKSLRIVCRSSLSQGVRVGGSTVKSASKFCTSSGARVAGL